MNKIRPWYVMMTSEVFRPTKKSFADLYILLQ